MKVIEEEKNLYRTSVDDETQIFSAPLVEEDPSIKKGGKKAAVGLSIPAIILLAIAVVFAFISTFIYSATKEVLNSEDAAAAVIGGLFLVVIFFSAAGIDLICSIISLGLSIGLLVNNIKKKLNIVYVIILLALELATIVLPIILFVLLQS